MKLDQFQPLRQVIYILDLERECDAKKFNMTLPNKIQKPMIWNYEILHENSDGLRS